MHPDVPATSSQIPVFSPSPESNSEILDEMTTSTDVSCNNSQVDQQQACTNKKKKKKRTNKTRNGNTKSTGKAECNNVATKKVNGQDDEDGRANMLKICRNKHWKYISSYHGPWLQLPIELLESLLMLNIDPEVATPDIPPPPPSLPPPAHYHALPATSSAPASITTSSPTLTTRPSLPIGFSRLREFGSAANSPQISRSSSGGSQSHLTSVDYNSCSPTANDSPPTPGIGLPLLSEGRIPPPPIDPGVFRCIASIRRRIDEAAELAVRASSGMSAGNFGGGGGLFGCMGNGGGGGLGYGYGGGGGGLFMGDHGGRNAPMSATRTNLLRTLAVQKLSEAYRADEIASSVMVMQRGTVFDDVAERVLKVDPNNVDAQYVHFFHEKIPSRQVAEATPTTALDKLILQDPHRLEYWRTRGIVHCMRDEYTMAVKDFTYVVKESRGNRRARLIHDGSKRLKTDIRTKGGKKRKNKVNGQAPPSGTAAVIEGPNAEPLLFHRSVLPDAPDPIESQSLFYRGCAHLGHALYLIEDTVFKLEEIPRIHPNEFGEVYLLYLDNGKYGGTELGNVDSPLGPSGGRKAKAYQEAFCNGRLREQILGLLRKSKRDHERFLSHFDSLDSPPDQSCSDVEISERLNRMQNAFLLMDSFRPGSHAQASLSQSHIDTQPNFTTYHPLMLESLFSVLICTIMLGEFEALPDTFEHTAKTIAGLEGYPIFLAPRSMAQSEFTETLERLAIGWKYGRMSNSFIHKNASSKSAIVDIHIPTHLLITSGENDTDTSSCSAGPSVLKTPPISSRDSPVNGSNTPDPEYDVCTQFDQMNMAYSRRSAVENLLVLLAAMRKRMDAGSAEAGGKKSSFNLTLHGARVETILIWLSATIIPELESTAEALL